jgi:fructose 1,6-bisphosphatase
MSIRAVPDDKKTIPNPSNSHALDRFWHGVDAVYSASPEITAEMLTGWIYEYWNILEKSKIAIETPGEFIYKKMEELLK